MGKHIVQCRFCKQKFDAPLAEIDDTWVMPSRNWYYHKSCYEEMKKDKLETPENWKDRIYDFIAHDLKVSYDYHMCEAQLKKFVEKDKIGTYKGIFFALKYFYEVRKGDWSKGHGGLGIIPYIYEDSRNYWIEAESRAKGTIAGIEKQLQAREAQKVITRTRRAPSKKENKPKWNLEDIE